MFQFKRRRKAETPPVPRKALPERATSGAPAAADTTDDEVDVDLDDVEAPPHAAATSLPPPTSVVGEDMEVRGPITTASPLRICGVVSGDITAGDEVVIDHGGQVIGKIQATRVVIRGSVRGPVASSGRLLIESTGRVQGDVVARSLHIDDGGELQGRCSMKSDG